MNHLTEEHIDSISETIMSIGHIESVLVTSNGRAHSGYSNEQLKEMLADEKRNLSEQILKIANEIK